MIRILLVDDHTILRQGLRLILAKEPEFKVIGEAACGTEGVAKAEALKPDLIIMDIRMPKMNGIDAASQIRQLNPDCKVLFLTVSASDDELLRAIQAGARGVLIKTIDAAVLIDAIHRVHEGEAMFPSAVTARVFEQLAMPPCQPLTEREEETLNLISAGLTNKEIAGYLGISQNTVKTHVRHILEKLHLRNRTEAAAYLARTDVAVIS